MRVLKPLCLMLPLVIFMAACGTPGAPQPPSLNLAKPVSDLKAVRSGDEVELTWTAATETTDGAKFRHRGQSKVCAAIDQPRIDQCTPLSTMPTPKDQKTASVAVKIPADRTAPTDYITYAVEVDNDRGRNAGLSNQVQIPTATVSSLNGAPLIRLTPETVLVTANVTPRNESIEQTLELRRTEKNNPAPESIVARRVLDLSEPGEAANIELRDDTFVWEKTYEYWVVITASTKVPNGETVTFDSAVSNPQELFAHDVFPPATPSGLQAVFSGAVPGQPLAIDLTWTPDVDRDLAGYFVFRRLQQEPASAAVKLNAQPVKAPAYHDTTIAGGNTYVYSVSAVDERGNESQRSEETSEQVPQKQEQGVLQLSACRGASEVLTQSRRCKEARDRPALLSKRSCSEGISPFLASLSMRSIRCMGKNTRLA